MTVTILPETQEDRDEAESEFVVAWNCLSLGVAQWAERKGWWDREPRNDAELIMLYITELAEAVEGLRAGNPPLRQNWPARLLAGRRRTGGRYHPHDGPRASPRMARSGSPRS